MKRLTNTLLTELKNVFVLEDTNPLPSITYPPEVIPNKTNVTKIKEIFVEIADHPFYKTLLAEAPYASANNILYPKEAREQNKMFPIPKVMEAPFECIDNDMVSRVSLTTWVLWFEDKVLVHTPRPTSGKLLCGSDIIDIKDPAEQMPEGVLYAVKVIVGTTLVDSFLRGLRLTHYSN